MKGFLLDTSVVSLAAPGRPPLSERLQRTLRIDNHNAFLATITVVELSQGIEKLRRTPKQAERAEVMSIWVDMTIALFEDRLLPFDTAAALEAGRISDMMFAAGRHPGFADVAIAATAAVNDLTVLTRNVKHFMHLRVPYLDPFAEGA